VRPHQWAKSKGTRKPSGHFLRRGAPSDRRATRVERAKREAAEAGFGVTTLTRRLLYTVRLKALGRRDWSDGRGCFLPAGTVGSSWVGWYVVGLQFGEKRHGPSLQSISWVSGGQDTDCDYTNWAWFL
jgi:hypothetical protein